MAIKFAPPGGRLLEHEARQLQRFSLSGITPKVLAQGETTESPIMDFLAMEYFDGGSLERRVATCPSPRPGAPDFADHLERIRSWFDPVLIGLLDLHANGLVHRDIAPANLVFHGDSLKLVDLGISATRDETRMTELNIRDAGRIAYLPPEYLDASLPISPRVDIYALGLCLYLALTGQEFFAGDDVVVLGSKRRLDVALDEAFPDEWCRLLRRMTTRVAEEQPTPQEILGLWSALPAGGRVVPKVEPRSLHEQMLDWMTHAPDPAELVARIGLALQGGHRALTLDQITIACLVPPKYVARLREVVLEGELRGMLIRREEGWLLRLVPDSVVGSCRSSLGPNVQSAVLEASGLVFVPESAERLSRLSCVLRDWDQPNRWAQAAVAFSVFTLIIRLLFQVAGWERVLPDARPVDDLLWLTPIGKFLAVGVPLAAFSNLWMMYTVVADILRPLPSVHPPRTLAALRAPYVLQGGLIGLAFFYYPAWLMVSGVVILAAAAAMIVLRQRYATGFRPVAYTLAESVVPITAYALGLTVGGCLLIGLHEANRSLGPADFVDGMPWPMALECFLRAVAVVLLLYANTNMYVREVFRPHSRDWRAARCVAEAHVDGST